MPGIPVTTALEYSIPDSLASLGFRNDERVD